MEMTINDLRLDILELAINGGINYWCEGGVFYDDSNLPKLQHTSEEMVYILDNGGSIGFREKLHSPKRTIQDYNLTYGIIQFAEEFPNFNYDNIDASVADRIVQYALFGELIYG